MSFTYLKKGEFDLGGQPPKVPNNVILQIGWFEKSIPDFLQENHEDIALLHLDPGLYSSHKTVFSLLRTRIKTGTIIIFDDYLISLELPLKLNLIRKSSPFLPTFLNYHV